MSLVALYHGVPAAPRDGLPSSAHWHAPSLHLVLRSNITGVHDCHDCHAHVFNSKGLTRCTHQRLKRSDVLELHPHTTSILMLHRIPTLLHANALKSQASVLLGWAPTWLHLYCVSRPVGCDGRVPPRGHVVTSPWAEQRQHVTTSTDEAAREPECSTAMTDTCPPCSSTAGLGDAYR